MKSMRLLLSLFIILATCSCQKAATMKPDFSAALQKHFDSIEHRDIEAFKSSITNNKTMYTIVQNGHAFTTPQQIIDIHAGWFKDTRWSWKGTVIHTVVGEDMAMAVVKYTYQATPEKPALESWLTYVFKLEDGQWKIVHDQNTALDFPAFAKSMSEQ